MTGVSRTNMEGYWGDFTSGQAIPSQWGDDVNATLDALNIESGIGVAGVVLMEEDFERMVADDHISTYSSNAQNAWGCHSTTITNAHSKVTDSLPISGSKSLRIFDDSTTHIMNANEEFSEMHYEGGFNRFGISSGSIEWSFKHDPTVTMAGDYFSFALMMYTGNNPDYARIGVNFAIDGSVLIGNAATDVSLKTALDVSWSTEATHRVKVVWTCQEGYALRANVMLDGVVLNVATSTTVAPINWVTCPAPTYDGISSLVWGIGFPGNPFYDVASAEQSKGAVIIDDIILRSIQVSWSTSV